MPLSKLSRTIKSSNSFLLLGKSCVGDTEIWTTGLAVGEFVAVATGFVEGIEVWATVGTWALIGANVGAVISGEVGIDIVGGGTTTGLTAGTTVEWLMTPGVGGNSGSLRPREIPRPIPSGSATKRNVMIHHQVCCFLRYFFARSCISLSMNWSFSSEGGNKPVSTSIIFSMSIMISGISPWSWLPVVAEGNTGTPNSLFFFWMVGVCGMCFKLDSYAFLSSQSEFRSASISFHISKNDSVSTVAPPQKTPLYPMFSSPSPDCTSCVDSSKSTIWYAWVFFSPILFLTCAISPESYCSSTSRIFPLLKWSTYSLSSPSMSDVTDDLFFLYLSSNANLNASGLKFTPPSTFSGSSSVSSNWISGTEYADRSLDGTLFCWTTSVSRETSESSIVPLPTLLALVDTSRPTMISAFFVLSTGTTPCILSSEWR